MANDPVKSTAAASTAPGPDATEGTSRQPHSNNQQNNQVLNPDVENAAGNAAAPGVVPTNQVNQPPAATSDAIEQAKAGNEPEPSTAVKTDNKQEYRLKAGKHIYTNDDGERITAKVGDLVPLTQTQFDSNQGRFERP